MSLVTLTPAVETVTVHAVVVLSGRLTVYTTGDVKFCAAPDNWTNSMACGNRNISHKIC